MIEILEIRDKTTRELIGNIDTAKSIIWKSQYYGVGEFEIYVAADPNTVEVLQLGNYVTRVDGNSECGIIEHIEITENSQDGRMIIASGRFIKSILDRRIVYKRTLQGTGLNYWWSCESSTLNGNVEKAVRKLINDNAVNVPSGYENRKIDEILLDDADLSNLSETIVIDATSDTSESAGKQVTYKNLLEYTDSVLQEYKLGAKMWLDRSLLKFRYKVYKGRDLSRNSESNPIIFSKEFDNLVSSSYIKDEQSSKTTALIGGEGDGTERKCAFSYDWIKGIDRREVYVDASSITQEELEIQDYRKQLESQGQQSISSLQTIETFEGELDLTNSPFEYGVDFDLGDIVTVEDKDINKYIDTRILTVTEVQDDDGYKIEIEYGD